MTIWLWVIFAVVVLVLVVFDLGLTTRRPKVIRPTDAFVSFTLWLLAAAAFSVGVYYVYESNILNLEATFEYSIDRKTVDNDGHSAWLQYLACYVLELALSLDNLAVLALLLAYYRVPRAVLGRALFWTILVTLCLRLLAIFSCAWFVREASWFRWVLGAILVVAVFRVLVLPDQKTDFDRHWYVRLIRRLIPISPEFNGQRLLTRVKDDRGRSRLMATPIVLVVLSAGLLDIVFAADSVPALFSITKDPTLAFTASTMAILGLRSLFLALSEVVGRFRYLRVSVLFILLYVAGKMFLSWYQDVPTLVSLIVFATITLAGVGASIVRHRLTHPGAPPPLGEAGEIPPAIISEEELQRPTPLEDITGAVESTKRNLRKIVVLIVGTLVVLVLAPLVGLLPGPGGLIVAAAGLGILATEFIWARRLLMQVKSKTQKVADSTGALARKTPVWVVPIALTAYLGLVALLVYMAPLHVPASWTLGLKPHGAKITAGLIIAIAVGPAVAVFYWAFMTVQAWRGGRAARAPHAAQRSTAA